MSTIPKKTDEELRAEWMANADDLYIRVVRAGRGRTMTLAEADREEREAAMDEWIRIRRAAEAGQANGQVKPLTR